MAPDNGGKRLCTALCAAFTSIVAKVPNTEHRSLHRIPFRANSMQSTSTRQLDCHLCHCFRDQVQDTDFLQSQNKPRPSKGRGIPVLGYNSSAGKTHSAFGADGKVHVNQHKKQCFSRLTRGEMFQAATHVTAHPV